MTKQPSHEVRWIQSKTASHFTLVRAYDYTAEFNEDSVMWDGTTGVGSCYWEIVRKGKTVEHGSADHLELAIDEAQTAAITHPVEWL